MCRNFWFIVFLMISALVAQASTLTFHRALILAYQNNPTLQAQVAVVEQAKGQFIQSRLYPNPSLAVDAANIGVPSTLESGYNGTETTISIEQPIPLGNRLYYQGEAAKMEYFAASLKLEATRSSLYIDVGNAFVDAFYAQYWTKASKRLVQLNELVVSSIKKRLEIGANSEVDLRLAEIALDEAIIVFDRARRDELKSKIALANLVGVTSLSKCVLTEKGLSHQLDTWPSIKKRILTSNLIKAQMALVKAMGSRITATAKQVWPDLNLQLGFRHFKLNDQKAAVVSASAPIPVFNRNQGNVYSALAKRNESIKELHKIKLNLDTTLYAAFLDGLQFKEEVQKVTTRMLPNANKAVELAREGFEQGRYSYLILNNSMLMLNREEEHYTKAHADYHKAIIKIQGLLMSDKSQEK
ncbi:TolC family protein [Legionella taurinensis]|uniref:TolC family protein n=1 Tax=Legionella taurinensis TaxID=70611 RepID=A0A3A5L9K7_9GAMM|nr:TolC family protein [Legionella taurinensis]RJT43504.1 TolC family protein [Legionella taurinensis]RJT64448.1 TolC family protein [Legionella taurinensis]STY25168.1 HelC protein [Legionella taurinensis]